jgi:hypothetical protein
VVEVVDSVEVKRGRRHFTKMKIGRDVISEEFTVTVNVSSGRKAFVHSRRKRNGRDCVYISIKAAEDKVCFPTFDFEGDVWSWTGQIRNGIRDYVYRGSGGPLYDNLLFRATVDDSDVCVPTSVEWTKGKKWPYAHCAIFYYSAT